MHTEVVKQQIAGKFPASTTTPQMRAARIKIENKLKSAELFDHYAKSLTGGA
jgi:hypothetical protein